MATPPHIAPGCSSCRFLMEWDGKTPAAPRRRGPFTCSFKVQMPPLPLSLRTPRRMDPNRPESRGAVWRGDGIGCPTWEARS